MSRTKAELEELVEELEAERDRYRNMLSAIAFGAYDTVWPPGPDKDPDERRALAVSKDILRLVS